PVPPLALPGLAIRVEEIDAGVSRFDLTLAVEEAAAAIAGSLEYSTDLFDGARIERLARHLDTLLGGALAAPAAHLAELPLLGAVDRHQLRVEWGSIAEDDGDTTVNELFARQVALRPAAVALRCSGREVSYGTLERRSNRLAYGLSACRIAPGQAVA